MYSKETMLELCPVLKWRESPGKDKFMVCTLIMELTRRCNLACVHCMKGDPEALDMSDDVIDAMMSQIGVICCLTIGGGEITLAPDRMRYVLDSAKRHKTKIYRVVVVTNGVIKSEAFLQIYREFMDYVVYPEQSEIRISNDRFHTYENGFKKKDYADRKRFYSDGKKNRVVFVDCEPVVVRTGRCEKNPFQKVDYQRFASDPEYKMKLINTYNAYISGKSHHLIRRRMRHNGRYICQIVVSANGRLFSTDLQSHEKDDTSPTAHGDYTDTLSEIIHRDNADPYMREIADLIDTAEDLRILILSIQTECGYLNLGLLSASREKIERMIRLARALSEVAKRLKEQIPIAKNSVYYPEADKEIKDLISESEKILCDTNMDLLIQQLNEAIAQLERR